VLERLAALYPIDDLAGDQTCPNLLNPGLEEMDAASVLSDQQLWISLCEQSFQGGNHTVQSPLSKSAPSVAPQFQWKYSDLRKEYYASLGLTIAAEQVRSCRRVQFHWRKEAFKYNNFPMTHLTMTLPSL